MSTTPKIANACDIAEAYGKQIGLADFEIDRVVHSTLGEKDEWIIHVRFLETDSFVEDDGNGAIIVVDSGTEEARLVEGL